MRGRFKRARDGSVKVSASEDERRLLRSLVDQLDELLDGASSGAEADPATRRLFPTAYPDDAEREAEYRSMVASDLEAGHRRALAGLVETIDADRLSPDDAAAWMSGLNQLRLVIGTRLDVQEGGEEPLDPDAPDAELRAVYAWLSWLLGDLVEAVSGRCCTLSRPSGDRAPIV